MRYFIDTEFMEDGVTIDLLSIGIVAEDGREFYRQLLDADLRAANEWVREHVFPQLQPCVCEKPTDSSTLASFVHRPPCVWVWRMQLRQELLHFTDTKRYGNPEFWGYYADYDWVALCQVFGRMIDLPKGWPMFCRDIKQLCVELGDPRLPEQSDTEHNALSDARWNRQAFDFLLAKLEGRKP